MQDLKNRMAGRFMLTTDGLTTYVRKTGVVREVFRTPLITLPR